MIRPPRLVVLAVLLSSVVYGACRGPQPEQDPGPPPINQDSIDSVNAARADSIRRAQAAADAAAAERRRQDSISAANARMEAERRAIEAARTALTRMINFDYNMSDIRSDAQSALDAKIPVLQANPGITILISGHADERGSDEYNIALGQRRAAAAKRYLTDRGIAENRINIVSHGEERPVAMGSDESSWAQNRRAEFEITAGQISAAR
jgi:peptidoglycan-associated lipoprotein